MISKVKGTLKQYIRRITARRSPLKTAYHFINNSDDGDIETYYITSDSREIPVLKNHRYSLKKCWSVFGPIAALYELKNKNLLKEEDIRYLHHVIGDRTISASLTEIRQRLSPYLEKYADLFISLEVPDIGKRLLKPSVEEINKAVDLKTGQHINVIEKIRSLTSHSPKRGEKVLEIGYTSGGESIIAIEKAGYKALGIDNFYYDSISPVSRHEYIRNSIQTKAEFLIGDITKETPIEEESVSLVISYSVLEHIKDLNAAFSEMYRLLRPGGVMFHRYDPYFYILGGHSHGTLDSPWAHMRLNEIEIEKYITELRPYEAEITLPWIRNALNRNHTQNDMQKALASNGFLIKFWENTNLPQDKCDLLNSQIVRECLDINRNISLQDLMTSSVAFIAEKPF